MKREQKAQVVDQIAEAIDSADAIYAIDYRGLSVPQAAALRTNLRDADATFRIVKNTLTLLAVDKSKAVKDGNEAVGGLKALVEDGPTALTFINGDVALAAKTLDSFARENHVLDFKGGALGTQVLTADDLRQIAKLPTRDRLNAQLAGVVASPITGLVRGLGSMVSGLAVALGQVLTQKEQKQGSAETSQTDEASGQGSEESGETEPQTDEEASQ